jgi:arabinofuranan 3-O-arabinosyltransferase
MTPARSRAARLGSLALLCYLPLLLTARGQVAADTKPYLYLDPARLLSRAAYLWDPNVAFGTVTHQNIGYLWPMGPWYWAFEVLGAPDWVAQRLWMGTLLFLAGTGILYLGRTIGPRAPLAWTAAAFVYALSPYVLDYVARISVLLLPWAALPWLLALTHLSLRRGRWREPALFALVVASAGGVNATALVLAGLGPTLWLVFAVFVHREVDLKRALAVVGRMGVLTLATNLWWIAGLAVQGGWGLDVLRYTETVETVARSSLASEVLRGLGYWFFYGTDKLGPWIEPGRTFTENSLLIAFGFLLPSAALVAAVVVRWRYRAFAVAVVLLGTAVAVGAYPYGDPSPIGSLFKRFATSSTAGLALRSTGRAVPLVILGLALLLAAGLAAVARRNGRLATGLSLAVILAAIAGNPALWTGEFVAGNLRHPEDVPAYWQEAADWLDAQGHGTRVLEIPGSDFATYRWGNHVDPITPGLMDRPYAARELVPFGTEASADLLIALDRRLQEGVLEPEAIVPLARLLGVGDLVVRGDLEYERYRTAQPSAVWDLLDPVPNGLDERVAFGEPVENRASPQLPMRDEVYLQTRDHAVQPPVAAYPVEDPLPIVRVRGVEDATLLEGDGEGVVDAAAVGLMGGDGALLSSASMTVAELRDAIESGARLVVTDTNRQRARRWGTVRDNDGYTERAGEEPLSADASDNRLPVFPDAPTSAYTTVEQRGVRRVQATRYGNPVTYTPADRPANAVDGDPGTAWVVGALGPTGGARLLIEAEDEVTTDHLDVLQAQLGRRRITRLGVRLDGEEVLVADLDDSSFGPEGQRIDLGGERTFTTIELVVEADSAGRLPSYADQNGVGLREVVLPGVEVDEVVALPQHLLDAAGGADNPLTLVLSRLRANPAEPFARDEEQALARTFGLASARAFDLTGEARIDATLPDDRLDELLGGRAGVVARSSGRLHGDLAGRASAAIDGDEGTAWTNSFGEQRGAWLEFEHAEPLVVDELRLSFVDDGDHSVPTQVTVSNEAGERRSAPVGADGRVRFPSLTGRLLRITIDDVRAVDTIDWFSKAPVMMPVAVAEVGLPVAPPVPGSTGGCRTDLLEVDGRPLGLVLEAGGDGTYSVATCDGRPVRLAAGDHDLRAAAGPATGIDLDRLVLATDEAPPSAMPTGATSAEVTVEGRGRTSFDLRVTGDRPVWVVLGQSLSPGWTATVDGEDVGEATLVDGFANGWLVDPGEDGVADVSLRWGPQRIVWAGLGVSALGVLACLLLVALSFRRRHELVAVAGPAPQLDLGLDAGPPPSWTRTARWTAVLALGAALVVDPLLGLAAIPVALVALRWSRGRVLGLGAGALLLLAGLYTAVKQERRDLVADFGWTDFFRPAHVLAWAALVVLAIALVADAVRRRRR